MSIGLYDYHLGSRLADRDIPFYALLVALVRRADSTNFALLKTCWPKEVQEIQDRYDAPGAILPSDDLPPGSETHGRIAGAIARDWKRIFK